MMDADSDCISIDCPVYYSRIKLSRDVKLTFTTRAAMDHVHRLAEGKRMAAFSNQFNCD